MEYYGGNLKRYVLEDSTRMLKYGANIIEQMANLQASGFPIVMIQALYAIVGAVALQRGGEVANDVVRERILNPLGLR